MTVPSGFISNQIIQLLWSEINLWADYEINWRTSPSYKYLGHGTFRGEIEGNGETVKTIYAKATVKTYAEVLVTTMGVSRGER